MIIRGSHLRSYRRAEKVPQLLRKQKDLQSQGRPASDTTMVSLLSHLQSQQDGPFVRPSSHKERVKFVVSELKRLGPDLTKAMIRNHDCHENSTFQGMWVVVAAQFFQDQDILESYLQNYPSDFIRRRAAKALSRIGAAEILQRSLFGEEISAEIKAYIVDLITAMPKAVVSRRTIDFVSSLRGKQTALVLACRCGTVDVVHEHLVQPLSNDPLPSHYICVVRLDHAIRSALRRFPEIADDLIKARNCPVWIQRLVLELMGKQRLTKPAPDGSTSFLELYITCPHRSTAWFLQNYVPALQSEAKKLVVDSSSNQSDLLLPVCEEKDFFDEEFMWLCKARNFKDPLGCLDLIRNTSSKRPATVTWQQAVDHTRHSLALFRFVEDSRNFPYVGQGHRLGVGFALFVGANFRHRLAWGPVEAHRRAYQFCGEWSGPLLRCLLRPSLSTEHVMELLSEFPHLVTQIPQSITPAAKALPILRRFLSGDEASSPAPMTTWGEHTVLAESFMTWLYANDRMLFELQARRAERLLPGFDLEAVPSWFVQRLPYKRVQSLLKAACHVRELPGVTSRGDGLCGLVECAGRSGGWAVDDGMEFMLRSLRNERDDVKEEVMSKVFAILLPDAKAGAPPHAQERAWSMTEKRQGVWERENTRGKKRRAVGEGEGLRAEEQTVGSEGADEWMVVEVDGEELTAQDPEQGAGESARQAEDADVQHREGEVLLGPRHVQVLERLLMLTLQSKRANGGVWLEFARRILTRALIFGEAPEAEMVKFASGVMTKLVEAKVVTEQARTEKQLQVHRSLRDCPLFGAPKTEGGACRKRGAYAWTAEGRFIVEAAKAVRRSAVEAEVLMLFATEVTTQEVRWARLRELLTASRDFARLCHRSRQELLNPLLQAGPGKAIPAPVVYESLCEKTGTRRPPRPNTRADLDNALASLQGKAGDRGSRRQQQQLAVWQAGAEWEGPLPGARNAPPDFDWDAAAVFYKRNPLLSARPSCLSGMFRWTPEQQEAAFERWILPAASESRFPLDLKTKARVLATCAGMTMASGRLEKVAELLARCGERFGDEDLDPADRAFFGQVGDQMVHALGREDRPREAIQTLVKHCFSGLSKGAVVQLGVVMRRVGISTIEAVVRGVHQDPEVRVGGRVALARTTAALDIPKPDLLLLQWAGARCHRDVGVALLSSLLGRPHLTLAHPELLVAPLGDLEAKLLASQESVSVPKGPEGASEFPVYVSSAILSQVCKLQVCSAFSVGWIQSAAGKALLHFVCTAVERFPGVLRDKALVAMQQLLCGEGLGRSELKEDAGRAGEALRKMLDDALPPRIESQAAEGTGIAENKSEKPGMENGEGYALAARVLVALAHREWLGPGFLLEVVGTLLAKAEGAIAQGAKALAIATQLVQEGPASWRRVLEVVGKGGAQQWWEDTEAEVLRPLLRRVLDEGLGGGVGAWFAGALWVLVGLEAEKAGAFSGLMLERLCEACEEGTAAGTAAEVVRRMVVEGAVQQLNGIEDRAWQQTGKQWVVATMTRLRDLSPDGGVRWIMIAGLGRKFVSRSSLADAGTAMLATVQEAISQAVSSSDVCVQAVAVAAWQTWEDSRQHQVKWAPCGAEAAVSREGGVGRVVGRGRGVRKGRGGVKGRGKLPQAALKERALAMIKLASANAGGSKLRASRFDRT